MNRKPLTVRDLINHLESLIKDNPDLDIENMLVAKEDYDDFAIGPSTWVSEMTQNDIRLVHRLERLETEDDEDEDEYFYDIGYSEAIEAESYYIAIN